MTLPNRPETHLISFDRSCFVQDGFREEYQVITGTGVLAGTTFGGPARKWHTYKEAADYARRIGGRVATVEIPIMRRISWVALSDSDGE